MDKIISFVMVGTNDLEKSSKFYDSILVHLGMKRVAITDRYIGYGPTKATGDDFHAHISKL